MKKTIKVTKKDFEIPVKRFYIPIKTELYCPECGNSIGDNLNDDYLSYPIVNNPEQFVILCDSCDNHIEIEFTIRMEIEYDPNKIKVIR